MQSSGLMSAPEDKVFETNLVPEEELCNAFQIVTVTVCAVLKRAAAQILSYQG